MLLGFLALAVAVPLDSPTKWFSETDYPVSATENESEGSVGVTLTISASGVPVACAVTKPAADTALNDRTCEILLERGRFKSIDMPGSEADQTFSTSVAWNLIAPKIDAEAMGSITAFTITPDGEMVDCKERLVGKDADSAGLCDTLRAGLHAFERSIGASLVNSTRGEIRMYMQPVRKDAIDIVTTPPAGAHYLALAGAEFDVLPSGKTANCVQQPIESAFGKVDWCAEIIATGQDAFKSRDGKIHMRLLIDLWAE